MRTIIYVVSSFRDYGDCEIYFSADGIFATRDMADAFVRQDIAELVENYKSVDMVVKGTNGDDDDYMLRFDGHTFRWRIDTFYTDKFMLSERPDTDGLHVFTEVPDGNY